MKSWIIGFLACGIGLVVTVGNDHRGGGPTIVCVATAQAAPPAAATDQDEANHTVLGVRGTQFTVNGRPTFLLGISYYAALGAPQDFVRRDLDDLRRHGFNWLRVFATWDAFDQDISAVDSKGQPRQVFLDRLKWLVAQCDGRGLVVDVTLAREKGSTGGLLANFKAHQHAVDVVVDALKAHRNWYLDLSNEHDVGDARYVPADELKALRARVRKLDPRRLVTASFGGHDLSEDDLRESLLTVGLDFVSPHRPRNDQSPAQTEAKTRACLATMKAIGRSAPIHYQEPFRRGYGRWEPKAGDFLRDLRGAKAGGAAGWCLHNGAQRRDAQQRPRRSFDMRARRLFDQLDEQERAVVEKAAQQVRQAP